MGVKNRSKRRVCCSNKKGFYPGWITCLILCLTLTLLKELMNDMNFNRLLSNVKRGVPIMIILMSQINF